MLTLHHCHWSGAHREPTAKWLDQGEPPRLEDIGCGRVWRCGNRQTSLPNTRIMRTAKSKNIPDRPSTGLTRTVPPVVHQGGPDKKMRSRDNTIIATCHVTTLSQVGKCSLNGKLQLAPPWAV